MIKSTDIHTGGCMCGDVKFKATGVPVVVAHCHCEECQRSSGAGHTTGAMFAVKNVSISGALAKFNYQSRAGNTVTKSFCPKCGSALFGQNDGMADHVTISLGTFDDSSKFEPEVVVFASNRKPWDLMGEKLMTFDKHPEWKPET